MKLNNKQVYAIELICYFSFAAYITFLFFRIHFPCPTFVIGCWLLFSNQVYLFIKKGFKKLLLSNLILFALMVFLWLLHVEMAVIVQIWSLLLYIYAKVKRVEMEPMFFEGNGYD